jgi:hypothetical protein
MSTSKQYSKSILLAIFIFCAIISNAQNRSMGSDGILGKLQIVIDAAEERDLEVVRIEADIIRTSKETVRNLDPSFSYDIVAVASNRIKDVDLAVFKKEGNDWVLVTKDDESGDIAAVSLKPTEYSEYKIVVTAYEFHSDYDVGHYGLVVVHD